jgi:hypothetical protein
MELNTAPQRAQAAHIVCTSTGKKKDSKSIRSNLRHHFLKALKRKSYRLCHSLRSAPGGNITGHYYNRFPGRYRALLTAESRLPG